MKKGVSPENVAHLWANKIQDEAATAYRNLYFNGNSIFLYGSHFEIARHVENKKGEKAVFFTTRSYSNTTAKHISIVRYACSHLDKIYIPGKNFDSPEDQYTAWINLLEEQFKLFSRARKPERYLYQIKYLASQIDCDSKILNYDVKSIDKNKIVIGCHTIKIDECNSIAKQLNWIK